MKSMLPFRKIGYRSFRIDPQAHPQLLDEFLQQGNAEHLVFRQEIIRHPKLAESIGAQGVMMDVGFPFVRPPSVKIDVNATAAMKKRHIAFSVGQLPPSACFSRTDSRMQPLGKIHPAIENGLRQSESTAQKRRAQQHRRRSLHRRPAAFERQAQSGARFFDPLQARRPLNKRLDAPNRRHLIPSRQCPALAIE